MDAQLIALVIAGGGVLGTVMWLLAKLGRALIKIGEALAAAAVVLVTVWLLIKAVGWALRQVVHHWCGFRRNGAPRPEVLEHLFRMFWCGAVVLGRSVSDGLAAGSPPLGLCGC